MVSHGERMKNVPWRYPFLGKLLPMKLANNFMVFEQRGARGVFLRRIVFC